jgi:hypothetical protein
MIGNKPLNQKEKTGLPVEQFLFQGDLGGVVKFYVHYHFLT